MSLKSSRSALRSILKAQTCYQCRTGPSALLNIAPIELQRRALPEIDRTCSRGYSTATATKAQAADAPSSGSALTQTDLLEVYRGLVAQGKLEWDDEQVRCIIKLRSLLEEVQDYTPPIELLAKLDPKRTVLSRQKTGGSWWKGKAKATEDDETALIRVLSGQEELEALRTPKGIMLTGPPGTGKSFLLSLFFDLLPTKHKRRWHYHAFTLYLYRRVFLELEKRRQGVEVEHVENMDRAAKRGWKSVFAGGRWEDEDSPGAGQTDETIPFIIAREMVLEYHILYFDELQLVDASSAALLRDVLTWYWRMGGVIVTCSNRVPDSLYHAGIQKDRMAGFLDALKMRCEVVQVDGGRDFRRMSEGSRDLRWYADGIAHFEKAWDDATAGHSVTPETHTVYGRRLHVPVAAGEVCRASFSDLCEQSLGPADYITLASKYSTIFIDRVPVLLLKNKNEARRLINLVDALYESRCQLYISSVAPLDELFFPDAVASSKHDQSSSGTFDHGDTNESIMAAEALSETLHASAHPNVSLYNPSERRERDVKDSQEGRKASAFSVLGIWTGEDERFAYKRAVSRLSEMTTSPTYFKERWIPLDPSARTWERAASRGSSEIPPPSTSAQLARLPESVDDDFAVEAGYSRPSRLQPRPAEKEDKPIISEKHFWGMVDGWGPKAGKWGKGAKHFEGKSEG